MEVQIDPETGNFSNIDDIRRDQYPSLENKIYLDHAGTTLYPKSLIEAFSQDLIQNLYGNPHSASESSQLSTRCVEDTRLHVLRFFDASPDDFEVVFTANATASIKLVADAFRDQDQGFGYGYHMDSHTSLIGVREMASSSRCFNNDDEVDDFLDTMSKCAAHPSELSLLAYPGQSNMTGRRFGLQWARKVQEVRKQQALRLYTLFDAAALASTSPLDLSNQESAPDFTAVSFYKIFGFPDLGALIIRKEAAHVLRARRYFGGGTVDSVSVQDNPWHAKKSFVYESLEDGTLPFHSILALKRALTTHAALYGSMHNVARHTAFLASQLKARLRALRHGNGKSVCELYSSDEHGEPTLSFNLLNKQGQYISTTELQKLAIVNGIHLRTGGLCNPGGIASRLNLSPDDLRRNYAAGYRCGSENDLVGGRPSGAIRISLGAMSNVRDLDAFVRFLTEYYVDSSLGLVQNAPLPDHSSPNSNTSFAVESLSIFPIKSCAAFKIPPDRSWRVGPEGLSWDREWCLVHQGTSMALSQKQYPQMALLYPSVDLSESKLEVNHNIHGTGVERICVDLKHSRPSVGSPGSSMALASRVSSVCGEAVEVEHYSSREIAGYFTRALGVPCTLARSPRLGTFRQAQCRSSKSSDHELDPTGGRPIRLSNESPILLVSRSSVNRLNEEIKQRNGAGKAVSADSFRGNIVIAEDMHSGIREVPYAEDEWTEIRIGQSMKTKFDVLGPCQRCQMVCVDQDDASRRREPFSTLSKTRRRDGRVWFGMHMSLATPSSCEIQVGDRIIASA